MGFPLLGCTWLSFMPVVLLGVSPLFAFRFIKALARTDEDCAVADIGLVITLWIVGGGESMGYLILRAEARHLPAHKVGPVVRDDGMRQSEVIHNVLPEKFNNLLPCDVGERYCFHPLYEVVRGD